MKSFIEKLRDEGRLEAREEAEKEAVTKLVLRLIEEGDPLDKIARVTGFSIEKLKEIKEKM